MNTNGVVLCNFDRPPRYLVVSDVHLRSVLKDQTYPGEIAAASSAVPSSYQAPMSTSERKTERTAPTVVEQVASASAERDDPQPTQLEDDGSGDISVARWLKSHGIKSSLIRELHAVHPLPIDLIGDLEEDTTVAAAQEE
eukprot:3001387-Amphidinium_carterae.1